MRDAIDLVLHERALLIARRVEEIDALLERLGEGVDAEHLRGGVERMHAPPHLFARALGVGRRCEERQGTLQLTAFFRKAIDEPRTRYAEGRVFLAY